MIGVIVIMIVSSDDLVVNEFRPARPRRSEHPTHHQTCVLLEEEFVHKPTSTTVLFTCLIWRVNTYVVMTAEDSEKAVCDEEASEKRALQLP